MKIPSVTVGLLALASPAIQAQPRNEENQYWQLTTSDECVVDGPCILSHPRAGLEPYENDEFCQFTAKREGTLFMRFFDTEPENDRLTVGDTQYSGSTGVFFPASLATGIEVTRNSAVVWDTDDDSTQRGFEICFDGDGGSGPYWSLINSNPGAECVVMDRCILSHPGAGVQEYMNDEYCEFQALQAGTVSASFFNTEPCCDHVVIDGSRFSGEGGDERNGETGPTGMPLIVDRVDADTSVVWDTDGGFNFLGFQVCYEVSGGSMGDPHFKLWSGEWFDFHGICDQVLTSAPDFADGLGLDIHIRTKPRYQYSYIEAAAIRIGEDVLQIGSWGEYWLNGVESVDLPITMGGKYVVERVLATEKQHNFVITLDKDNQEQILVNVLKDMINVSVKNASKATFGTSSGLLGSFPEGLTLARDGATVMEDHNSFGQEWQVMDADPQLFHSTNIHQEAPGVCVPPTTAEGRRLGEGIDREAAEKACAHHKDHQMKDMCIFDVMAMADLEVAQIHGAF